MWIKPENEVNGNPVNLDIIKTFLKHDGEHDESDFWDYQIQFIYEGCNQCYVWDYKTAGDRDKEYDRLIQLLFPKPIPWEQYKYMMGNGQVIDCVHSETGRTLCDTCIYFNSESMNESCKCGKSCVNYSQWKSNELL